MPSFLAIPSIRHSRFDLPIFKRQTIHAVKFGCAVGNQRQVVAEGNAHESIGNFVASSVMAVFKIGMPVCTVDHTTLLSTRQY